MRAAGDGWAQIERTPVDSVEIAGVGLSAGSRVMLCPRHDAEAMDAALRGRTAVIESIEESAEGVVALAVVVEDDPGRMLGEDRQVGHRFFFSVEEVAPLAGLDGGERPPSVLVAGIGNVFMGDDGFGVAVAQRLAEATLPVGVRVVDFGIRGIDLVHALADPLDLAIILDALPGGQLPGTLSVVEPEIESAEVALDPHGLDPMSVLSAARRLGAEPARTLIVGCEPLVKMSGQEPDVVMELSPPVQAAVERAVELVGSLLAQLTSERTV